MYIVGGVHVTAQVDGGEWVGGERTHHHVRNVINLKHELYISVLQRIF